MPFPPDTQADLEAFYSVHQLRPDGRPTVAWEKANLITIPAPYPLTLAWDLSAQVKRVTCHKLVAESIARILNGILQHYGDLDGVRKARMHLYGGCYNYRRVSGSGRLSTHAWGAGVDLDPDRNPLGKPYDEHDGMMPQAVVAIFEGEGWKWGGRFQSRPDCMHFQATS
jgi:D-alanyl-D-alanine carboxypeptidase-like protein